jgi:hypothetical protein
MKRNEQKKASFGGCENVPSPGEKQGKSGGAPTTIKGTGKGAAQRSMNPLTASFDSRPLPDDYKKGATRAGGGSKGKGSGSGLVKNVV